METVIWFLVGLVSIPALGLAAWSAPSEWPSWARWCLALGVLAVSTFFTDLVALLLIVVTIVATSSLAALIALRNRPGWAGWAVAFGVISLVAVSLLMSPLSMNGSLLLLASLSLLLSLASAIWMVRPSTDQEIRRSSLRGALVLSGLSLFAAWHLFGMVTFERMVERTVSSARSGEIDSGADGRVQWEIRSARGIPSWVRDLRPVSDVDCGPYSLLPTGVCCHVKYQDGSRGEIHIFRTGLRRYSVRKLTVPSYGLCRNASFDPRAAPESTESRQFVPCTQSRQG